MATADSSSEHDYSAFTLQRSSVLLYVFVLLSGVAGLGYQMVWSRMLAVSLGHESVAVIAVVSAFFIGLTLGALTFGQRIRKSAAPHLWFIVLELVIAAWALSLIFLVPAYNQWVPKLIGIEASVIHHWTVAFGGSFLLLLPATAAMGATLPCMERIMAGLFNKPDRVAGLYASNTLGAVIGTVAATFYLMPQFGLTDTLIVFATLNLACAAGVWLLCRKLFRASHAKHHLSRTSTAIAVSRSDPARLASIFFITGLLGIGYEILVIRVLSQILENTVYSFAMVLSVYLLGTALGSAMYQRNWASQQLTEQQWSRRLDTLVIATSSACLLGVLALWFSNTVYLNIWQGLGRGFIPALLGEFSVAAIAFLLPTIAMGALFSHLAQKATHTIGLGVAIGFNTLGSAVAPIIFGIVVLPLIGAKLSLLLICVAYLLVLTPTLNRLKTWAILPLTTTLLLFASPLHLRFIALDETDRLVAYREGVMATLAVIEDNNQHRFLKVNNHFTMGGTASRYSDHRQTHIPLLLHGEPQSVLYLGVGTGITLDAARYYPNAKIVGVELIPESLPLMPYFGVNPDSAQWTNPPRLIAADARRYVMSADQKFDVIVGEIFHPARDGAGSLYTVEHFTAVKNLLNNDGLFCQWLPLFQLDMPSLKTIIRTFVHVFPHASLHLGHYSTQQPILCLEGSAKQRVYPQDYLLQLVTDRTLQNELVQMQLNSDFALFGGFLGSSNQLKEFAGTGPLNSDDHPVVTFQAPMLAYANEQPSIVRLSAIIDSLAEFRQKIVAQESDRAMHQYWQARDRYLSAALSMEQVSSEDWDSAIRSHLLDVVSISGDFEPAYFTLLMMAQELYARDPRASFELLNNLHTASPNHPEALQLQRRLFAENLP